MFEIAITIAQGIGDEPGLARRYSNLAETYLEMGDTNKALQFFDKDLQISKRVQDWHGAAISHLRLGNLYIKEDDLDMAQEHLEQASALFAQVGDTKNKKEAERLLKTCQTAQSR